MEKKDFLEETILNYLLKGELTQMLWKICFRKAFLSLRITEN